MKRKVIWFAVATLALLVLGAIAFVSLFEEVAVTRFEAAQPEAQRNPYLALERFMQRMGRPVKRDNNAQLLDHLPASGGVLILDANRRAHLTPARLNNLLTWIEHGGYVIATPELAGSDPLLEFFDIGRFSERRKEDAQCEPAEESDDAAQPAQSTPPKQPLRKAPPARIAVNLPDHARPLTIGFSALDRIEGKYAPAWSAKDPDWGAHVLHFTHGKGHLTMLSLRLLTNTRIGRNDEAELLWALIQKYQPQAGAPIILMTRLHLPTLREWLTGPGQTALLAGLLLLALWLWRSTQRFGPIRPEPEPNRRQLREHLTAVGRYVWRAGGLNYWLEVARDHFFAHLGRRQPAIAKLPPVEMVDALNQLTQRPAAAIGAALFSKAGSIQHFTEALRTLRSLERSL